MAGIEYIFERRMLWETISLKFHGTDVYLYIILYVYEVLSNSIW